MFIEDLREDYADEVFEGVDTSFDADFSDRRENEFVFDDLLIEFFESLIDDDSISEQFHSKSTAQHHFKKHCGRTSHRTSVYYDFTNVEDYMRREEELCSRIKSTKHIIKTCVYSDLVAKNLHKLFEGNTCIRFDPSCGILDNSDRPCILALCSWANPATTNYNQNTVDLVIQSPDNRTLTMYPLDANYLEGKLGNIFQRSGLEKFFIIGKFAGF